MTVYASMLRGINLGGRRIKMDDLRRVYAEAGLEEPQTLLQSGNVVFRTGAGAPAIVARRIEAAIEAGFGFRAGVVLRTADELRAVLSRNPFPEQATEKPNWLLVSFLAGEADAAGAEKLAGYDVAPDAFVVDGREVYLRYAEGVARSKLNKVPFDRLLGAMGTARNWNTVEKLLAMTEAMEGPERSDR